MNEHIHKTFQPHSLPHLRQRLSLFSLLDCVSFRCILVIEEYEAEEEEAAHHRECAGVVRVRGGDEALILGVMEWAH